MTVSLLGFLLGFPVIWASPALAQSRLKIPRVTVTAYHTSGLTASGAKTRRGYIALSRDLEKKYRLRFGDTVIVKGIGRFTFKDRLPRRWRQRVDIYMTSRPEAKRFGKQYQALVMVRKAAPRPRNHLSTRRFS